MRLNAAERLLLNNPARRAVQEFYEAPLLLAMAGRLDHKRVLEIGCGQGFGIKIILRRFGAARVLGIDIDPKMVGRARKRISACADRADVVLGSATAIPAATDSFDAVFDFGVIHHVPAWRDAIREIRRVLKPGGLFVFEEVSKQALDRWVYRTLFEHPREDRFTAEDFTNTLGAYEIAPGERLVKFFFGDFFAGVGQRQL